MTRTGGDPPDVPAPRAERRVTADRRRYNRRPPVSDVSPPYYEVFDRIATSLEQLERMLSTRVLDLERRGD